jgi:PAS domain S-box-containing protein
MGYKVNPPSTEELRQMAVQRLGSPVAKSASSLTAEHAKKLLEEVAISKIEVEIQNVYLQDTCARLDVALNEITDLYDFAPVGFVRTDAAGKISKLNLICANLRNALMGRVFADFFFPDQRNRIQALMRRASETGEDQCCDVSLGGANRVLQHVQLSLSPLYTVQGHHMVLTNLTTRHAVEDGLRANNQGWKAALEATGDGLWDWDLQTDTLWCSLGLTQLYGSAAEQRSHTLDRWRTQVHPEDWPALLDHVEKCLNAGDSHFLNLHRRLCRNGQWIWVQCRGSVLERDEHGQVTRMAGTDTDVSEHKRLEDELQEVERIQQSVFELLPQYLAVLDRDGRVLHTNAVWNAYALASGHAYRNGFARCAYADLLDAVTGGAVQVQRDALAGIADVLAGKVPSFQLEYSCMLGLKKHWFIMHVMAVQGVRARALVSHQDVSRIKGHRGAPAAH